MASVEVGLEEKVDSGVVHKMNRTLDEGKEPEPLLVHQLETVGSDGDMPKEG